MKKKKEHWYLEEIRTETKYTNLSIPMLQELDKKCKTLDCWIGSDYYNYKHGTNKYTMGNKIIGEEIGSIMEALRRISSIYGEPEIDSLGISSNLEILYDDEEDIARFFITNITRNFKRIDNSPLTNRQINKLIELTLDYNKVFWKLFWRGDDPELKELLPYVVPILNILYNKNYTYFKLSGKYNQYSDLYCIGDDAKKDDIIKMVSTVAKPKSTFHLYLVAIDDAEDPIKIDYKNRSKGYWTTNPIDYEQDESKIKEWLIGLLIDNQLTTKCTPDDITIIRNK